MRALQRVFARILHPFPPFPLIAGQYSSALEARVCAEGAATIEPAFTELTAVRAIADAFVRFMCDPEAERALKKAYHVVYEQRARVLAFRLEPGVRHGFDPIDTPLDDHPLDGYVRADLAGHDARAAALKVADCGRYAQLGAMLAWAFLLAVTPIYIVFRYGRRTTAPRRVDVLACESVHDRLWAALVQAANDTGCWRDGTMAILRMNRRDGMVRALPIIDASELPVPRTAWWREVAGPALRLACAVLSIVASQRSDPRIVEIATRCLNLACTSLNVRRVGYGVRFKTWLDDAEHDPIHTLKAIVARACGARAVRFPRTEQDSPGSMMSFIGYDIYPSGGPYQGLNYGASWNPRCRIFPIGLMQHDRRLCIGQSVTPEYERAIRERLAAGKKMAVFFGPSGVPGLDHPMRELFAAVAEELAGRSDWFLVLKPKLDNDFSDRIVADSEFARWKSDLDLVTIRYAVPGFEVCSSSWLIALMAFGAGWQGTIAIETLTQAKPFFCWYPFIEPTPYKEALARGGFLYNTFDEYRNAVRNFVAAPVLSRLEYKWFREQFDSFGDDNALGRLARLLFAREAAETQETVAAAE